MSKRSTAWGWQLRGAKGRAEPRGLPAQVNFAQEGRSDNDLIITLHCAWITWVSLPRGEILGSMHWRMRRSILLQLQPYVGIRDQCSPGLSPPARRCEKAQLGLVIPKEFCPLNSGPTKQVPASLHMPSTSMPSLPIYPL